MMKWKVNYTVDSVVGGKTEHTETVNAGPIRDAAMKANALIVRPKKQDPQIRNVTIWSLQLQGRAANAST